MGVAPTAITVRDQRSRWGSASRAGSLSFSWRLVLAPPFVLDAVVTHELGHLRHADHSQRFWALVRMYAPRTDEARRWLRANRDDPSGGARLSELSRRIRRRRGRSAPVLRSHAGSPTHDRKWSMRPTHRGGPSSDGGRRGLDAVGRPEPLDRDRQVGHGEAERPHLAAHPPRRVVEHQALALEHAGRARSRGRWRRRDGRASLRGAPRPRSIRTVPSHTASSASPSGGVDDVGASVVPGPVGATPPPQPATAMTASTARVSERPARRLTAPPVLPVGDGPEDMRSRPDVPRATPRLAWCW